MTSIDHTAELPTAVLDEDVIKESLDGPVPPEANPPRRRLVVTIVAVVLVVATAAVWAGYRAWDARVEQALTTANADLSAATTDLAAAVATGEETLADSEGRVVDEAVRSDLEGALAQARGFSPAVPEGSHQDQTDAAVNLREEARGHTAAVVAATALTVEAVEAWELDQALTAHETAADRLTRATVAAQGTLAATEEQVGDNAVREELLSHIETATAVAPLALDESLPIAEQVAALEAATNELTTIADALDATRQDALDAHGAWQAEQERIAAEALAAAQAAAAAERTSPTTPSTSTPSSTATTPRSGSTGTTTPSTNTPSTGSSSSTGAARPAPSTPAPAPAPAPTPAPSPDQSGWFESGSDTWCGVGDTSGAEGTGAWC